MKTTFIYALNDPSTGLMRYIGKSDNPQKRCNFHIYTPGSNDHRGRWISSLLSQGLKPELQILLEIPQEGWQRVEQHFIRVYRALGFDLVNTTEGGDSPPSQKGRKASLETRLKLSAAHRGKKPSPETLAKLRAANTGRKPSPETIVKMSVAHKGKKRSTEHCLNISAALRKRSPEIRANISAALRGRKFSPETINRMRIAQGHKSSETRRKLSLAAKAQWQRRKEKSNGTIF